MTTHRTYGKKALVSIGSERNQWLHETARKRECTVTELVCLIIDNWRLTEGKGPVTDKPATIPFDASSYIRHEGLEDLDRGLTVAAAHANMALWGLLEPTGSMDQQDVIYNLKQAVTSVAKLQFDLIDP